jgi:hypothetical protein
MNERAVMERAGFSAAESAVSLISGASPGLQTRGQEVTK